MEISEAQYALGVLQLTVQRYLAMLSASGHLSPDDHATITSAYDTVSKAINQAAKAETPDVVE